MYSDHKNTYCKVVINALGNNRFARSTGIAYLLQILAIALRVQTLPASLTVKLQKNVLKFSLDCLNAAAEIACVQWKDVTVRRLV